MPIEIKSKGDGEPWYYRDLGWKAYVILVAATIVIAYLTVRFG